MKKINKKISLVLALIMTLSLAACGSAPTSMGIRGDNAKYADTMTEAAYDGGYAYEDYSAEEESYNSQSVNSGDSKTQDKFNDSARKLIKKYNMTVETEAFDQLMNEIDKKISELSGYVQDLNTYNGNYYGGGNYSRSSSMTVRIPTANLEAFVEFVGNAGYVTNKNLNVEDVTLSYVDTKSRKESYEVEMERMMALLEQAETMDDIIRIESRISELRYMLESMESQLRTYDNLVDYATVNLNIEEVKKYTEPEPETFGERVARSFANALENLKEGFKNFIVGLVGAIPGLIVFAIVVTIIVFIIRAIVKSAKKRNLKKEATRSQQRYEEAMKKVNENVSENVENK